VLLSFIGGLGGRRFRPAEFDTMLAWLQRPGDKLEKMAEPILLFAADECRQVGRFFSIAREGEALHET
jgi:hypothetical protein